MNRTFVYWYDSEPIVVTVLTLCHWGNPSQVNQSVIANTYILLFFLLFSNRHRSMIITFINCLREIDII